MKRLLNKWIIALLLILTISGVFIYIKRSNTNSSQYITSTAAEGTITESITASGFAVPQVIQNANFSVAGKIAEIDVKEGDHVTPGQQLAKLDTTSLENQVEQSKVVLDQADNSYNNAFVQGMPTQYDMANLQEAVNTAQDKLNLDENSLSSYELLSPKNGIITSINASVGQDLSQSNGTSPFMLVSDSNNTNPTNTNFTISGKISEIDVQVGQSVTQGQLLAKLDTTSFMNQLEIDQSALNIANNNLKNKTLSSQPSSYSTANLKDAITSAQEKLSLDEQNLNEAILTSNINGIVSSVNGSVGDSVNASGNNSSTSSSSSSGSGPVISIIDPSSLQVNLQVDESNISQVKQGQIVQLSFSALPDKSYVGKVQSIDMSSTTTSNVVYYGVKVSIDKLDSDIKPGMSADATIIVQTKDDILTVPNSAIQNNNGQTSVEILQNNKPVLVPVTTGISDDTNTEITDGLNEGDKIITSTINPTTATSSGSIFGGLGGGGRRTFTGGG